MPLEVGGEKRGGAGSTDVSPVFGSGMPGMFCNQQCIAASMHLCCALRASPRCSSVGLFGFASIGLAFNKQSDCGLGYL